MKIIFIYLFLISFLEITFYSKVYSQYQKTIKVKRTEKSAIIFPRDTSGFIEVDKNSVTETNESIIRFNEFAKLYADSLKKLNFKIYNVHPEYICFMDDSTMSFKHPINEHLQVFGLSENPTYIGGIIILIGNKDICQYCVNLDIYKFISNKLVNWGNIILYPNK